MAALEFTNTKHESLYLTTLISDLQRETRITDSCDDIVTTFPLLYLDKKQNNKGREHT